MSRTVMLKTPFARFPAMSETVTVISYVPETSNLNRGSSESMGL